MNNIDQTIVETQNCKKRDISPTCDTSPVPFTILRVLGNHRLSKSRSAQFADAWRQTRDVAVNACHQRIQPICIIDTTHLAIEVLRVMYVTHNTACPLVELNQVAGSEVGPLSSSRCLWARHLSGSW